jgi:hypothetical protein
MDGDIESRANGGLGGGGEVEMFAFGDVTIASACVIDVAGGSGGGGEISIGPLGDINLAGLLDSTCPSTAIAGGVSLDTDGHLELTGDVIVNGGSRPGARGTIDVTACSTDVEAGGSLENKGANGTNDLLVRERLTVKSGGLIKAPSSGSNTIRYRDPAKPPILTGTVSPTATKINDTNIAACQLCGNGVLDGSETCDDDAAIRAGLDGFCTGRGAPAFHGTLLATAWQAESWLRHAEAAIR